MPSGPKWDGLNRHARDAKEREQAKKEENNAKAAKAKEDAMWANDEEDKNAKRREEKRLADEAKRAEAAAKKAERDAELAREQAELDKAPKKVLVRDLQKEVAKMALESMHASAARANNRVVTDTTELPKGGNPNQNRNDDDDDRTISASGLTCASHAVDGTTKSAAEDRHIGRRAKVLFKQFRDEQLPKLKEGKQRLRLSQMNDIIWAMWQKCPQNPFVQRAEARAAENINRKWYEDSGDDEEETTGAAAP